VHYCRLSDVIIDVLARGGNASGNASRAHSGVTTQSGYQMQIPAAAAAAAAWRCGAIRDVTLDWLPSLQLTEYHVISEQFCVNNSGTRCSISSLDYCNYAKLASFYFCGTMWNSTAASLHAVDNDERFQ